MPCTSSGPFSTSDKGGEFIGKEYNEFCASEGIRRQHTEPHEPHQNGVAERANAAGATAGQTPSLLLEICC